MSELVLSVAAIIIQWQSFPRQAPIRPACTYHYAAITGPYKFILCFLMKELDRAEMTANLIMRQVKVNSRCDRSWAEGWCCRHGSPRGCSSSLILLSFSAPSNIAFPVCIYLHCSLRPRVSPSLSRRLSRIKLVSAAWHQLNLSLIRYL